MRTQCRSNPGTLQRNIQPELIASYAIHSKMDAYFKCNSLASCYTPCTVDLTSLGFEKEKPVFKLGSQYRHVALVLICLVMHGSDEAGENWPGCIGETRNGWKSLGRRRVLILVDTTCGCKLSWSEMKGTDTNCLDVQVCQTLQNIVGRKL